MPVETRSTITRPGSIESVVFYPVPGKDQAVPDYWLNYGPITEHFIVEAFEGLYEKYTPNSEGSHNEWKSFQHYKRVGELPSTSSMPVRHRSNWYNAGYDGSQYGWWGHLGYHTDRACGFRGYGGLSAPTWGLIPFSVAENAEGEFIPDPADLARLTQQALSSMMPSVKQELSILNSVYELKDMASLKHTFQDAVSITALIKTLATKNSIGKIASRFDYYSHLRDVLRYTSGGYLQWSFNIAPLIQDVQGLISALRTVERRVNALITASAKTQRKHYIVPLSEFTDSDETSSQYLLDYPGWSRLATAKARRLVLNETSKFHVMIEYNYNYTQYQIEHARLLGLLDAIGVNLNPRILWNAVKWSFLIDWVFSVGKYLEQFGIANMKPVVNIRRALWSIRRQRKIVLTYDMFGDLPRSDDSLNCPASVVHETAYRRQVFTPTESSIISSGLSRKEFSLGAALVTSRKRRHKR